MPLTQPLPALQQHLRDLLLDNPADALKELQTLLPAESDKRRTADTLLGELNDTNKQRLRGILSNDELQRAYNRLRAATLDLIDSLEIADFEAAASPKTAAKAAAAGEILYRIPHRMPARRETRCLVRIALDAEAIVENIVLDEHVTLKPLVRVSDLMQVELLDPSADAVFRIRGINSPEQFVEETGYTEWQFFVTPLQEGTFPLMIKVSVIELIMGKERKKEIVLEEQVEIRADQPMPVAEPAEQLKSAGEKLVFAATPRAPTAAPGGAPQAEQAVPPPPPMSGAYEDAEEYMPSPAQPPHIPAPVNKSVYEAPAELPAPPAQARRGLRTTVFFLVFLMLGAGATWAFAPHEVQWALARLQNTPEAYAEYARKYPQSRHREKAAYRRAVLLDTPEAYRAYLQDTTLRGQYRAEAEAALKRVEPSSRGENPGSGAPENETLRQESEQPSPSSSSVPSTSRPAEANPPSAAFSAEDMVLVRGGTFQMGSHDGPDNEKPPHSVSLGDFYLAKYEVTQAEWRRVMGRDPANLKFKGCDQCPVDNVSWDAAQQFIKKLNAKTGLRYRLPTEAEWEFAARGGNGGRGYRFAGSNDIKEVSWYAENAPAKTRPVGRKKPNELGLFDMTGNIQEWCNDWYDEHYYADSPLANPHGPYSGQYRVRRGGSCYDVWENSRVSARDRHPPDGEGNGTGFRLARN